MKRDSYAAKGGQLFETMAEWMVGEGELKALTQAERMTKLAPVVKLLEKYPKLSEAVIAHPEVVRHLPDAIRQGIIGTTQAAAHGADLPESLESGAVAGSLGLAGGMIAGAAGGAIKNLTEKIQPTVRDLEGVKFTQLASEARGPNGEVLNPTAARAANISREPAIRAEREGAFKQLQTNLAQKGVRGALEQANTAAASSATAPAIQNTAEGWRYIPPDGSTSLSAPEARATLNEMRQRWLDGEWAPGQEDQFKQAYNDMKGQLDRHETLTTRALPPGVQGPAALRLQPGLEGPTGPDYGYKPGAAPVAPHNVDSVVNATTSYGEAAAHLDQLARQQLRDVPEGIREQYLSLAKQRQVMQDAFDEARLDPKKRETLMQNIATVNGEMTDLFKAPGTAELADSPGAMSQPMKLQKLSGAFQELQNTMDHHFNLRADTAAEIDRPRVATKLNSLADDIEDIKTRHGDVLNPVLGDQGLNHIIELGDLMNVRVKRDAVKTILGNATEALKDHFGGKRSILAAGGAGMLGAHILAGHFTGGVGAAGLVTGEGIYRMLRNRIATDPEFAAKVLTFARDGSMTSSKAGQAVAALALSQAGRSAAAPPTPPEEDPDAGSQ